MSKSIIYAGNSTTQTTVAGGTTIQFPNVVRRYGCNLAISGGNVVAEGTGYYNGTVMLILDGTTAGTANIQVLENGTAIPYALANVTVADATSYSVTIPFVARITCGCQQKTISVNVSGVAVDVTNASIVVEKE